jgi:hypothetical protein
LPPGGCFGSENPKRRPRDEMALMVEGVVDGGMDVEKTLARIETTSTAAPCALVAVRFDGSFQRDLFVLRPRS